MAFEDTLRYFAKAATIMGVSARVEKLLVTPVRQVKVQVTIEMGLQPG